MHLAYPLLERYHGPSSITRPLVHHTYVLLLPRLLILDLSHCPFGMASSEDVLAAEPNTLFNYLPYGAKAEYILVGGISSRIWWSDGVQRGCC